MPNQLPNNFDSLELALKIGKELLVSDESSDKTAEIAKLAGDYFGLEGINIFKVPDALYDSDNAELLFSWYRHPIKEQGSKNDFFGYDKWKSFFVNDDYVVAIIDEFEGDGKEYFKKYGINCVLMYPIFYNKRLWGVGRFENCSVDHECNDNLINGIGAVLIMLSSYIIRRYAYRKLIENEHRWYKAIEGNGEGVWDYNIKDQHIYISKNGKKMLGIKSSSEFISIKEMLSSANIQDLNQNLFFFSRLVEDQSLLKGNEFKNIIDGEEHSYIARGTVVERSLKGEPLRIIGMFSDITENKKVNMALQKALVNAESANKAKSAFLATMSHEIRTPLNGMLGFIKILSDYINDDNAKEYLRIIDTSAESLMNIINSILDFAKIEGEQLELENTECSLNDELETLVRLFCASAVAKHVYIRSYIDPDIPLVVKFDQLRIRQVLSNLLNNALKFTPEGGTIYFEVVIKEKKNNIMKIFFSVRDTGIGIAKEHLSEIFKPFTQADSSISRKFGGSGLGLTIAYKIVELMGGKINIESSLGNGASFSFTLDIPFVKDCQELPTLSDKKVAFIDYQTNQTWNIGRNLGSINVPNQMFKNADDFLRQDVSKYFALVVSFFFSNDDILKELKKLREEAPTLKILLIAYPIDLSVFEYITKLDIKYKVRPFSIRKLFMTLDLLGKSLISSDNEEVVETNAAIFFGHVLIAEDNEINSKLIQILLDKFTVESIAVENGSQAVEKFNSDKFNMIFMDINMPVMDGISATKEIRRIELIKGLKRTPIIALTANAFKEEAKQFMNVGMDAVLTKPIDRKELEHILRNFLIS